MAMFNNNAMTKMPTKISKTFFCLLTVISGVNSLYAQTAPALRAVGGMHGIWVICGEALPKNFSYRIFRQKGSGDWQKLADVKMPASKDEVQATLLTTERAAGIDIDPLNA